MLIGSWRYREHFCAILSRELVDWRCYRPPKIVIVVIVLLEFVPFVSERVLTEEMTNPQGDILAYLVSTVFGYSETLSNHTLKLLRNAGYIDVADIICMQYESEIDIPGVDENTRTYLENVARLWEETRCKLSHRNVSLDIVVWYCFLEVTYDEC